MYRVLFLRSLDEENLIAGSTLFQTLKYIFSFHQSKSWIVIATVIDKQIDVSKPRPVISQRSLPTNGYAKVTDLLEKVAGYWQRLIGSSTAWLSGTPLVFTAHMTIATQSTSMISS